MNQVAGRKPLLEESDKKHYLAPSGVLIFRFEPFNPEYTFNMDLDPVGKLL